MVNNLSLQNRSEIPIPTQLSQFQVRLRGRRRQPELADRFRVPRTLRQRHRTRHLEAGGYDPRWPFAAAPPPLPRPPFARDCSTPTWPRRLRRRRSRSRRKRTQRWYRYKPEDHGPQQYCRFVGRRESRDTRRSARVQRFLPKYFIGASVF